MSREAVFSRRPPGRVITPALVVLAAFGFAAGCPSTPSAREQGGAPASSLSGKWRGSSAGLSVSLSLEQTGDSVKGSGKYQVASGSSIGCGGETIPASGDVSLTGTIAGSEFQGHMSFGGVWIPPYLGSLKTPDSLDAHFMSVDRGACTLPLVRQH
jgi:hypothetical protein